MRAFQVVAKAALLLAFMCVSCTSLRAAEEAPEVIPPLGDSDAILAIDFSTDGKLMASIGTDGSLKIFDVASRRAIRALPRDVTNAAFALAFVPNTHIVAAAGSDPNIPIEDPTLLARGRPQIKLWDIDAWQEVGQLPGNAGAVWTLAFSPDGRMLAAGGADHTVKLWDWRNSILLQTVRGFGGSLLDGVAFSRDGVLAMSASDHSLHLIDAATGRTVRRLRVGGYGAGHPAFSPDGSVVAAATAGECRTTFACLDAIALWDVATGRPIRVLHGHSDYVRQVAFSADGRLLASASLDATVRVWDIATGQMTGVLGGNQFDNKPQPTLNLAFSPDGRILAVGLFRGGVKFWDPTSGREQPLPGRNNIGAAAASYSPDGHMIATAGFDGVVRVWDAATGREIRTLKGHSERVTSVVFTPDGRLLASASADMTVRLWEVASGRSLRILTGHTASVNALAISPDGRTLASGSGDRTIKLWDLSGEGAPRTLLGHTAPVNGLAFSPDGTTLASGAGTFQDRTSDNATLLWNLASGSVIRAIHGHTAFVESLAFSPDGKLLASSSEDSTVKVWDPSTGAMIRVFQGFTDRATVAFSPNGRILAAASVDNLMKVWDVATGLPLHEMTGHADSFGSVSFSPDGRTILAASWSGTTRIWDAASGSERASFAAFKDGSSLAITPEGYYDASGETAEDNLSVRVGLQIFPIGAYREKFFRPDLVRLSLSGHALAKLGFASLSKVRIAPIVDLGDVPTTSSGPSIAINVKITDNGGGIGQVRLFLNGTAVVQDGAGAPASTTGSAITRAYTVHLANGSNALRAVAFNADNSMQSNAAVASVFAALPAASTKGKLHALVVGIQEFRNQDFTLRFPVADARLFADTLKRYSADLFETVDVELLITPEETTRDNIVKALKAMQASVGPEDLFVFYVASHGLADDGDYYLITSNVGAVSTDRLKTDALTKEELTELVANIQATKKLMVLDTCHAAALGSALQAGMLSRGLDEATALKILGRAVGTTILSASASTQQALEGYQGHGLFTYVVAEGLMGRGDVDKAGFVSTFGLAHYVEDQVPDLAEHQFHRAQYPMVETSGQEFPLTKVH